MKRWLMWSLVSVSTFLVGSVLVFACTMLTAPIVPVEKAVAELPPSPEQPLPQDDFVPEFRDLPNFDEIEYRKPPGKLIELFEDGIYRRSDVVATNGENWLVLSENRGEILLVPSTAKVTKLRTVSWPGHELDARLSFNVPGKQIIAVNGLRKLRPGSVLTLFNKTLHAETATGDPDYLEMSDGFKRQFTLGDKQYLLRASYGMTNNGAKAAVLLIESGSSKQILKQIHYVTPDRDRPLTGDRNIFGSLLWVGDMDLDGKLDLYFDEFNEKGFTATELHLSTYAENGKLVGLAADFGMPGC